MAIYTKHMKQCKLFASGKWELSQELASKCWFPAFTIIWGNLTKTKKHELKNTHKKIISVEFSMMKSDELKVRKETLRKNICSLGK